jgi:hypothetical protein
MYTIDFSFTSEQLDVFYATGTQVVLAKPTAGEEPKVAWQVFRPLESIQVQWEEQYGIYASATSVTGGARLDQISRTDFPAVEARAYVITPSGSFGPPTS